MTDQFVLGVSAFYHDSAPSCQRRDRRAAHEERSRAARSPFISPPAPSKLPRRSGIAPLISGRAFYASRCPFERILRLISALHRGGSVVLKAARVVTEQLHDIAIRRGLGGYSGRVLYAESRIARSEGIHPSHSKRRDTDETRRRMGDRAIGMGRGRRRAPQGGIGRTLWSFSIRVTYHLFFKVTAANTRDCSGHTASRDSRCDLRHTAALREDGSSL